MKGLTRVDHDGKKMYGWLVRAYGGGQTFSKYFSDRRYGGREQSKKIAVEYLEKLTKEVKERFKDYQPRQNQAPFRVKPGTANTSGVVGIHRCRTVNHGKPVTYWAATWNENGRPRDKKFYFGEKVRSEEEAKKLAIEWRAKKILEMSQSDEKNLLEAKPRKKGRRKKIKSNGQLDSWVIGLKISEWSPSLGITRKLQGKKIKKREPLNENRINGLKSFLGVAAALFDWSDIDYDFGRGVFEGDVRSRCFWNTRGYRTDVIVNNSGQLVVFQSVEPDDYYLDQKNKQLS